MRSQRRREKGIALVAAGIFMVAMLALAAIAVEVARLTDTATEVQVSADVGAMGAAVARAKGKTETDAIQAGTDVAALNWADGKPVDPTGVLIEAGHYDPAAAPGSKFATAGVPHNAFRSTVTVSGVRFLMASILNGQSGTNVQKQALAAADCPSDEASNLPMTVCTTWLNEIQPGDTCSNQPQIGRLLPDGGQTACWTHLGQGTNSAFASLLPETCRGGGGVTLSQGDSIELQNGADSSFLEILQCCVACQDQHAFVIPVTDCTATASCNQNAPTLGFAAINIAGYQDVITGSSGMNNCQTGHTGYNFPGCSNPAGGRINNSKLCNAACTNAGTACNNNNGCTGCTGGCDNSEKGIRANQTCLTDTGGSGGGRCFGTTTVVLGQQ